MYDIQVVDLEERTVRTVTASLPGSSLFPSWTRDGRLSFRYDSDAYRGFMFASDVLSTAARPLPTAIRRFPAQRSWSDIFPETPAPAHALTLVLIWAPWSAHSPEALADAQRALAYFRERNADVDIVTATEPGSRSADVEALRARHRIALRGIPLAPARLALTEAHNQIPTTLLFRGQQLVDRRLGAQPVEQLREWITGLQVKTP